jgi:queuine tRNA-ribosyltransferase
MTLPAPDKRGDQRVEPSLVKFELIHSCAQTGARRGRVHTPHGTIETPVFMPVGTAGSVKAIAPDDLHTLGAKIILGNTYHLMLRPGERLIGDLGGLHRFISWDRAMLTDSGGFQVYSLSEKRKITEEGATFQSHLDGSKHVLTPERSIEIQEVLGADIIMAFDECPPAMSERAYMEPSLERTTRWLHRCVKAWNRQRSSLFGIVQGGLYEDLRKRHAEEICALDLPGYALGGFAVGEAPEQMHAGVAFSAPLLPKDKPRYLMGVGTPLDLVTCVGHGIDMFDCVLPTRSARNSLLFTSEAGDQERAVRPRRAAARPEVQLLHVQDVLARVPAAPLRLAGAGRDAPQHAAQPALLLEPDGRRARGHRAGSLRRLLEGVPLATCRPT